MNDPELQRVLAESAREAAAKRRAENEQVAAVLEASRKEAEAKGVANEEAAVRAVLEATRREAEAKRVANEEAALRAVLEATRREEEARIRVQEEANMKAVLEANRPEEELIKESLKTLLTIPDPNMRTAALYFVELENLLKSHPEWIRTQGGIRKIIFEIQEKLQSMLLSDTALELQFLIRLPILLTSRVYGPTGVKRTEFLAGNKEYQAMKQIRNAANAKNAANAAAGREEAEREERKKEAMKKLAKEKKEEEVTQLKAAMNTAEKAYTNNSSLMKGNPRAKQRLNTAKAAYEKAKKELDELAKLKGGKKTKAKAKAKAKGAKGAKGTRKLKKKKTRSSK